MEGMKNISEWGLVFWRVSPFSSSFSSRLINRVCLCWGIFWGYHQSVSWLMVCCISSELHVMPTPIRWLQLKRWFIKSKSLAAKLVYQFGSLTSSRNTAGSVVDSLLRVKMFCFCFLYCRGGSINYMDSKVDINILPFVKDCRHYVQQTWTDQAITLFMLLWAFRYEFSDRSVDTDKLNLVSRNWRRWPLWVSPCNRKLTNISWCLIRHEKTCSSSISVSIILC